VDSYRNGTEDQSLSEDDIWQAKELYDSAFHPQTGEKLFIMGRMSFQVPGNMVITGCMMTFYRSIPAVLFWQTANQTFNAIVNYTNRNASAGVTNDQLGTAYVAATSASVLTAVAFNKLIASSPALATSIVGRFVPLIAVAAANCVNIPLMRQQEIKKGIAIETDDGQPAGLSSNAAYAAIGQVVPSRVGMAVPGMFIPPLVMSRLEKSATFIKNPWLKAPTTVSFLSVYTRKVEHLVLNLINNILYQQVLLTGLCLTFSTPMCCALFPQKAVITLSELEPALQEVTNGYDILDLSLAVE
jgi:sideroflexin-1/3